MATGDIPKVRDEMLAYAIGVRERQPKLAGQLMDWRQRMFRDRHTSEPPATANRNGLKTLPDGRIKDLINYKLDHPGLHYRTIGDLFNVDGGRVSDAMGSTRNPRLDRLRTEVAMERNGTRWSYTKGGPF